MQESPVRVNPATPSDHSENAHEHQYVMAEIDLANGQVGTEQGTAATDLKLASEQTAIAHAAAATAGKALHCLLHNSTVTYPENGQWRDCASQANK